MQTLTPKKFFRALPLSLLIVASIWVLIVVFLFVLPSFSLAAVHKEDRDVVEGLRRLATWTVVACTLCGGALGICVPLAIRWGAQRRKEKREEKSVA
jgi:hypothetical protein